MTQLRFIVFKQLVPLALLGLLSCGFPASGGNGGNAGGGFGMRNGGGGHGGGGHGGGHGGMGNVDLSVFEALPEVKVPDTGPEKKVWQLGKSLFHEKKLSKSDSISCSSCHQLGNYGVDNDSTSAGHNGQRGTRNSPTVYNASLHISQFWDGRAATVEEQALGPITNPVEMAMPDMDAVVSKLEKDARYPTAFAEAFANQSQPISSDNIAKAIGAFERTLVTPSRFDKYLAGDSSALSGQEKSGLMKFVHSGCASCHNGVAVGGNSYQKLGLAVPYDTEDLGRFNVTKLPEDKQVFKVPSLRNVQMTAPYFHDGSIETLEEAIRTMGYHQLGRSFPDHFVDDVAAFLKSLTGELPEGVL